ncbi:vacuolar protein-sorting-associated protein 37 homolog 1 isoform X2 [Zea mays]|uniref:vacuolar protein-sorting-associated protein 37 homolog 1 isoform X2 n=1 Tax=Zea mays TaxID=4577 RepID=UPI0009A9956E|nr:vacuolar protein-sorting-associated protein 37 homolog 1 isoform X2 [Zea mays]|eukprot:XP_020399116.1 vacuolar protein-sorting-associated protein 37 homolog 1 isoform X2 [Zea mays]
MSWRFPLFGSSQQQQSDPNFQDIPMQSWYPTSVVGLSSSPATPTSSSSSPHQRASNNLQFSSRGQPSPAEAAEIIAHLKDKSIEELQRLLKEKEAYNAFFNTFDQVKTQNNVRGELRKETLQLARENLEKEQRILELGNQCTIIRTTQLAAAQDRLTDLERQKDDIMRSYSPAALLDKLQTIYLGAVSRLWPREIDPSYWWGQGGPWECVEHSCRISLFERSPRRWSS